MKRYMIFAYPDYYPSGGMHDFYISMDDREEAEKLCRSLMKGKYKNAHVADRDSEKVIYGD